MLTPKTNLVNLPLSVATTSILMPLAHYLPDIMVDKIKCQMFYKLSFSLHQPTLLPHRSFYFTELAWHGHNLKLSGHFFSLWEKVWKICSLGKWKKASHQNKQMYICYIYIYDLPGKYGFQESCTSFPWITVFERVKPPGSKRQEVRGS